MAWSSSSEPPRLVPSGRRVAGIARVPGSKSWTHRAYAIAFLSARPVRLRGALRAEDPDLFAAALARLGFRVEFDGATVAIEPPERWPGRAEFFCGNAGTLLRLLVGLMATRPGIWKFDGIARLRERPLGPLLEALESLGIQSRFYGKPGCVPLAIESAGLRGGSVRLAAGDSSQFVSSLLLAGQKALGPLEIEAEALSSRPYVSMTEEAIRQSGGTVEVLGPLRWRTRPAQLRATEIAIEADCSAAAYPAAAAALTGGELVLERLPEETLQGDRKFLDVLATMGARLGEESRGLRIRGGSLRGLEVDLNETPDQVPTLAALAPFAAGLTRIRNVAHLRLKESDRLAVTVRELRRLGVPARELPDGLEVPGVWADVPPPPTRVTIDPEGDHRIAMSFAVLGLRRGGVSIATPRVVEKSFPGFFEELERWLET